MKQKPEKEEGELSSSEEELDEATKLKLRHIKKESDMGKAHKVWGESLDPNANLMMKDLQFFTVGLPYQ